MNSISDNKKKNKVEIRSEAGFHFVKYPIWLMKDEKLMKSDLATYRALLVFADRSSGECYPSQEKIAELSRYTRRTVNKSLKRLGEAGYIEREDRGRQTVVRNGRRMVVDKTLLYTIKDITYLSQFKNHFEKLAKEKIINENQLNELNDIFKRHPIPSFTELNNKLSEVKNHQCETTSQGGCETTSHELELSLELEPVKEKVSKCYDSNLILKDKRALALVAENYIYYLGFTIDERKSYITQEHKDILKVTDDLGVDYTAKEKIELIKSVIEGLNYKTERGEVVGVGLVIKKLSEHMKNGDRAKDVLLSVSEDYMRKRIRKPSSQRMKDYIEDMKRGDPFRFLKFITVEQMEELFTLVQDLEEELNLDDYESYERKESDN